MEKRNNPRFKDANTHWRVVPSKEPEVYCIRNIVIVIMESESKFSFVGKLLVKVLYGAVRIYGNILDATKGVKEVYSPNGYSHIVIETSKVFPEGNIEDVWKALLTNDITRDSESKLQVAIDKVRSGTAIIVLEELENNLTHFLKRYYPLMFPCINHNHYYPWMSRGRAEVVLQSYLHFEKPEDPTCKIIVNAKVTDIAEEMLSLWRMNKWSCTLIAGGKNVGKSTNVRYLINTLLHTCGKVVLIDVDPGQAECTPAGCISYSLIEEPLLGPNFTHLKTPVYQLFIDEVDISRCVTRYLEGVKMLSEKLKECPVLSRLPVVVNTMGFVQSIGWDLIIFTIKLIRPSYILQINSKKTKNNYALALNAENVNKQKCSLTFCDKNFVDWSRPCDHDFYAYLSNAENSKEESHISKMEPYQQRELVMISYLSDIARTNDETLRYDAELPININQAVPYAAPFSSLCIVPRRLHGVPISHALRVINGNIVALCGIDLALEESTKSKTISGLQVLTQRSPLCTCYGFGIIRAIDMKHQKVFINSPLPMSIMQHVNCLACCIPIPPMLLHLRSGTPYTGGNAMLPTSREPRLGKLRT